MCFSTIKGTSVSRDELAHWKCSRVTNKRADSTTNLLRVAMFSMLGIQAIHYTPRRSLSLGPSCWSCSPTHTLLAVGLATLQRLGQLHASEYLKVNLTGPNANSMSVCQVVPNVNKKRIKQTANGVCAKIKQKRTCQLHTYHCHIDKRQVWITVSGGKDCL